MSSNNAMLDAVNELLHHDNFDLQIAAVRVLGATQMLDDRAVKSMCDLLAHSANVELHAAIIDTFRAKPHPLALKYLVQSLARDSGNAARALTALIKFPGARTERGEKILRRRANSALVG